MRLRKCFTGALLSGLACLAATSPALAQDASTDDGWHHSVIVYLLAPTISGTTGIGPADLDLEVDSETVFDTLEGAFLGMYAAEKDGYGLLLDVVYMDLEQDLELPAGFVTGEIGNKQLVTMLAGTMRMSDSWRLIGGFAYTDVKMRLALSGPQQQRVARRNEDWFDPIVGAVYSNDLSQRWQFSTYGVVGGFGVGSDLLWSVNAALSWQMSDRTALVLGARYIDYDYEDGSGADRFKFDVAEYGPAVGVRWEF